MISQREKYKKELDEIVQRYNDILDKLESLNSDAFELERQMMYLRVKIEEDKKNDKIMQSC